MAGFNQLDKFTDEIVYKYKTLDKFISENIENREQVNSFFGRQNQLVDVLYLYYETLNGIPKFAHQRMHCKKALFELCPARFQGYFKQDKP